MTEVPLTEKYGPQALQRLAERVEYEAWLLEAIYNIAEDRLFSRSPDAVIYPLSGDVPTHIVHASAQIVLGDWRPGFLRARAPLVLVTTFKLLDMLMEWALEQNGISRTFRFKEKIRRLSGNPEMPKFVRERSWLFERLVALYSSLEPLRGTIIHDRHFTAHNGELRVASSRGDVVGPVVEIGPNVLRSLALVVLGTLRYIDGSWSIDDYREMTLKRELDTLSELHGLPLLGQREPFFPTVRVYSADPDPRTVDVAKIRAYLDARYASNDCIFDLRVVVVDKGVATDAFLFPWAALRDSQVDLRRMGKLDKFRVEIPTNIEPKDLAANPTRE